MRYISFLLIILLVSIGCSTTIKIPDNIKYATLVPEQMKRIKRLSNSYIGKPTSKLLLDFPNAKITVVDTKNNEMRYLIKYEVLCSGEEELLAPVYLSNTCWIEVYYFSKAGKIVRYSATRKSLY